MYSWRCADCSCGAQALECVGFSSWPTSSLVVGCVLSCPWGMWALSAPIRDQTHIPYMGRRVLNYRTTKEAPRYSSSDEHFKKTQQVHMWILSSNLLFQRNMFFCSDTVVLFHVTVFKGLLHVWGSCVILELPKNKTTGNECSLTRNEILCLPDRWASFLPLIQSEFGECK